VTARRNPAADVIVVGAGLIGCTIARLLAERGRSVLVIERDSPGRRATWAAGGMLSPLIESAADDPFFRIADRSFDLYPALVDAVQIDSGLHVGYRTAGKLQCALSDTDAASLQRLFESPRAQQYGLELLDGGQARRMEPGLSGAVTRALFVARDHSIDNRMLVQAMAASAETRGARFTVGVPVQNIEIDKSVIRGVRLSSGELLESEHVVIAGGAWSSAVEGLPRSLPVEPVRGQMLCVDARAMMRRSSLIERVVGTEHCYMIPRSDGRVLVGATVEHVGFEPGPTPAGLAWLIEAAMAVLPGVGDLPILESWAGYRPGTPDDWPIIGADPDVRGLVYATGHYRNGILLAPVTAEAVGAIIDGNTPPWIEPFAITRFASHQESHIPAE
jgi:glycine oxidase